MESIVDAYGENSEELKTFNEVMEHIAEPDEEEPNVIEIDLSKDEEFPSDDYDEEDN